MVEIFLFVGGIVLLFIGFLCPPFIMDHPSPLTAALGFGGYFFFGLLGAGCIYSCFCGIPNASEAWEAVKICLCWGGGAALFLFFMLLVTVIYEHFF